MNQQTSPSPAVSNFPRLQDASGAGGNQISEAGAGTYSLEERNSVNVRR